MSNNQNTQTANNTQSQNQSKQGQPQADIVTVISRQQSLIEGLAADRDVMFKATSELSTLVKQMREELAEVKAELKEEKVRQKLQAEAEQKAMALVESFKTAVEAGGLPGTPAAVNGGTNNGGGYDRLHYLFKFGDKRRRGIF